MKSQKTSNKSSTISSPRRISGTTSQLKAKIAVKKNPIDSSQNVQPLDHQKNFAKIQDHPPKLFAANSSPKNLDAPPLINDSCFIVSENTQLSLKHIGSSRNIIKDKQPNPTTFSNARTVSYIETKDQSLTSSSVLDSYTLKNSAKNNRDSSQRDESENKILKSQNYFSATQKKPQEYSYQQEDLFMKKEGYQSVITSNNCQQRSSAYTKQSFPQQYMMSKAGQSTTMMSSSVCHTMEDKMNRNYKIEVDGCASSSSGDDLDHSGLSCDEGNVEISQYVISKQVPRAVLQFVNSFQSPRNSQQDRHLTLERILSEGDKQYSKNQDLNLGVSNTLMSTQTCTFMKQVAFATTSSKQSPRQLETVRKDFEQRQLSPSRIQNNIVMSKLPSKILPTIAVGDMSSEASRSQNSSEVQISGECSVPDIITNSMVTADLLANQSASQSHIRHGSIGSLGPKMFPVSHREVAGPMVTHNSCLQASYNERYSSKCSSSGSSILEGDSRSDECSCCRMNSNISNTLKSQLQSKFMINLETILLQEIKLWGIFQLAKETKKHLIQEWPLQSLMILCEEWWSITKDSACMFDLYKIYRDAHTRKIIRKAMILECTIIVYTAYFNQVQSNPIYSDERALAWLLKRLIRLYSAAHQNLLHIICLVLQRMGLENCDQNVWAVNLKQIINAKIETNEPLLLEEGPRNDIMQKNNCSIVKILKQMWCFQTSSSGESIMFTNISFVLDQMEKTHINRVKDILIQSLSQETAKHQQLQSNPNISQQQLQWQEYPIGEEEDLECEESIQLPPSPQQNNQQLQQIDEIEEEYCNEDIMRQNGGNLSTINEDCSYSSGGTPPTDTPSLPYLPPLTFDSPRRYTLVLDLDETLIHYIEHCESDLLLNQSTLSPGQFLVRPGAHKFLQEMSKYYEIVIFTAAMQDYADWVLDQLDVDNCISHRLYRQHAIQQQQDDQITQQQFFIKDLSRLGRELNKTLIVDNVAENFQLQPDNGVFIRTWLDDPHDNALEELAPLLKEIVVKGVVDVREALHVFRIQMMEQVARGILKPQLSLDYHPIQTMLNPEEEQEKTQKQFRQIQNHQNNTPIRGGGALRKYHL